MSPAYFAMVMATGIVGLACQLEHIPNLPDLLLGLNLVAYAILWILTILRARYHRLRFLSEFGSHLRGPGLFTTVAATAVLGTQLARQLQMTAAAQLLFWFSFALWLVLTYAIFTALTVRRNKPALEDGINGGWLTAVVATQSLVVLACAIVPESARSEPALLGLTLLWLAGGMLYIWMISLIFYRYTFFRFDPQDLTPPYWINMGAMAISTLSGVLLIGAAAQSPLLLSLLPFLKGMTLLFWATATWWIPMLVILGVWRYVHHKVPLIYDPLYWGAVFPLAMYTVATHRLADCFQLPFLLIIPRLFVGLALTAWLLTFLGLVLTVVHGLRRASRERTGNAIV
ncbi:MAG: tellurite resistance/C4-dicarboxylate transporter family protein [Rhodocyclaceae bacterium]|nr:tellurite resistance/C4-dicarboxylate transporter family protein [Rhodocyclaceae bacterium]